ncbi:hypothetical protein ACFLUG_01040 [Chloroflexota bacterium]
MNKYKIFSFLAIFMALTVLAAGCGGPASTQQTDLENKTWKAARKK